MAACPLATQDITLNLRNRGKAIDKANYGPMNPNEPNDRYWADRAAGWEVSPDEARKMRCGNCAAFNRTTAMLGCIEQGLAGKEPRDDDAMETVEAGELGFCEIFDFKCAGARTCDAWIVGGPITDEDEGGDGETETETEGGEDGAEMDDEED